MWLPTRLWFMSSHSFLGRLSSFQNHSTIKKSKTRNLSAAHKGNLSTYITELFSTFELYSFLTVKKGSLHAVCAFE